MPMLLGRVYLYCREQRWPPGGLSLPQRYNQAAGAGAVQSHLPCRQGKRKAHLQGIRRPASQDRLAQVV